MSGYAQDAFDVPMGGGGGSGGQPARKLSDFADNIIDIREYDVPYHHRFAIDTGVLRVWWGRGARTRGACVLIPPCLDRDAVRPVVRRALHRRGGDAEAPGGDVAERGDAGVRVRH